MMVHAQPRTVNFGNASKLVANGCRLPVPSNVAKNKHSCGWPDCYSADINCSFCCRHAINAAVREIGQVVESIQTADEVMRLADRHGVELPIAMNVRDVLHGDISPAEGLARLMAREQKAEYPSKLFG